MDPVAMDAERPMWGSAKAFALAVCGAGSGFGTFFRLPYLLMKHGAGSFFLAHLVTLVVVATPMTLIELVIGQHYRKGCLDSLTQISQGLKGVGIAMIGFVHLIVALTFSAVLSWGTSLLIIGAFERDTVFLRSNSTLPAMKEHFFESALYSPDENNYSVLIGLAVIWMLVAAFLFRGVKSVSVLVYALVPLPVGFSIAIMIYSLSGDGAFSSLSDHMKPQLGDLASWSLWADAVGQSLLVTQAATGLLIAYGSFTRPVHNCYRLTLAVLGQAVLMILVVTFTVVSVFNDLNIPTGQQSSLDQSGMWATFVLYPKIISRATHANALMITFSVCVQLIGLQSVAGTVQSFFTVVRDRLVFLRPPTLVIVLCIVCMLVSSPMCFRDGYEFVLALDTGVLGVSIVLTAAFEAIGIGYMWAERSIMDIVNERGISGCTRFKTIFVVAYSHSVGKIQEVMASQGRTFVGNSLLPLMVKLLIPVAGILLGIAHFISAFFVQDRFSLAPTVLGIAFPIVMVGTVIYSAIAAPKRKVVMPWSVGMGDSPGQSPPERGGPSPGGFSELDDRVPMDTV